METKTTAKRNYDRDYREVSHVVYLDAGHTTNGNPRRGWIVFDGDRIAGFVQEDHAGKISLFTELILQGGYTGGRLNGDSFKIQVSVKTFNEWKNGGKK
jgi:hypothetical protein